METLLLTPFAAVTIMVWNVYGTGYFGGVMKLALLVCTGVVISLPLLWISNDGKRLRYTTLSFVQYLILSIQLIIGVYLYHEPFTQTHSITFVLIWTGLVIFSINSLFVHKTS